MVPLGPIGGFEKGGDDVACRSVDNVAGANREGSE